MYCTKKSSIFVIHQSNKKLHFFTFSCITSYLNLLYTLIFNILKNSISLFKIATFFSLRYKPFICVLDFTRKGFTKMPIVYLKLYPSELKKENSRNFDVI